jgi:acyl-CoA thioester hydrolase
MLRHVGIENSTFQDCHGLAFVVRHIDVDFIVPAHLDDELEVSLKLTKVGGASLECEQTVRRDGQDLVRMMVRLGCMKLDGGAGRLPKDIRTLLQTFETQN